MSVAEINTALYNRRRRRNIRAMAWSLAAFPVMPATVTPDGGESSADCTSFPRGTATLMTVVRPTPACRG